MKDTTEADTSGVESEAEVDQSVTGQLKRAGGELKLVLAPAVGFGLLAFAISATAGSLLFDQSWITALMAVLVTTITAGAIVLDRVNTLGSMEPANV